MRTVPSSALALALAAVSVLACAKARESGGSTGGALHGLPFVDVHTSAALADISSCTACHGADYGAGSPSCNGCHEEWLGFADWKTNCSFCHGTRTVGLAGTPGALAAPPRTAPAVGDQTHANPKVGAHQAHLVAGNYSNPLPCDSCHAVPEQTFPQSFEHIDGSAEVQLSDFARKDVASPGYSGGTCAVYCHGSTTALGNHASPEWTSSGALTCTSCHAAPPASGYHSYHDIAHVLCGSCHPGYSVADNTVDLDTHVNGTLEATPSNAGGVTISTWPSDCASVCHQ